MLDVISVMNIIFIGGNNSHEKSKFYKVIWLYNFVKKQLFSLFFFPDYLLEREWGPITARGR